MFYLTDGQDRFSKQDRVEPKILDGWRLISFEEYQDGLNRSDLAVFEKEQLKAAEAKRLREKRAAEIARQIEAGNFEAVAQLLSS